MTATTDKHCLWCGTDLDRPGSLYCSAGHSTKQREHRRKVAGWRRSSCPTPTADAFPHRGSAFRAAAISKQFPYLCRCGVFHLTADPRRNPRRPQNRRTIGHRTINQLARELNTSAADDSESTQMTASGPHALCRGSNCSHNCAPAA